MNSPYIRCYQIIYNILKEGSDLTFNEDDVEYYNIEYSVHPKKLDHSTVLTPKMQQLCTQVWEHTSNMHQKGNT